MIVIVDNGKGAGDVAALVRGSKEVIKPAESLDAKASGVILSDGDSKHSKNNIRIIEKFNKPLLGIGIGYIFLVSAYGIKPKNMKFDRSGMVKVERPCPLTLDVKKVFAAVQSCNQGFDELPGNFEVIASSPKYEFKIIQETEKPFFGVHFNPEMGGDGLKILDNFAKFAEVWSKYHKK